MTHAERVKGFVESQFTCEQGAPWRWADLYMMKPYELQQVTGSSESWCADRMISNFVRLKGAAGFAPEAKPKLYWRWLDGVRWHGDCMEARIYLDGNPGIHIHGNPSKPRGRPTVGMVRLPELAQAA